MKAVTNVVERRVQTESNAVRRPANAANGGGEHPGVSSDLELLALILGRGRATGRHWRAARELLARATLAELAVLDAAGILEVPRASLSAQVLLHAALELARRLTEGDSGPRILAQAADVHAVSRDLELARREHFVAFMLDARNRVLARETISVGTLSASLVHPREVFGPAIERRAASVIVVHNHPSGDPEPSADDLALTRRLVQAGTLIGIEVLDHLVIGYGSYVSLKSRGLM